MEDGGLHQIRKAFDCWIEGWVPSASFSNKMKKNRNSKRPTLPPHSNKIRTLDVCSHALPLIDSIHYKASR